MGKIPAWYKGRKVLCDILGDRLYERCGQVLKQRGLNVSRHAFDDLTDEEREEQIKRRIR